MKRSKNLLLGLTVLLLFGAASTALAVIDPNPNRMSIYFDLGADAYQYETAPYVIVPAYVVLTNPDFDLLWGYSLGVEIDGPHQLMSVAFNGEGPIATGCLLVGDGCIIGLAGPLATSPATLIATLSVFVLGIDPISFTLHGTNPSETGDPRRPDVLLADNEIRAIDPSFWNYVADEPAVCAVINGGIVAAEATTWDALKSLYR